MCHPILIRLRDKLSRAVSLANTRLFQYAVHIMHLYFARPALVAIQHKSWVPKSEFCFVIYGEDLSLVDVKTLENWFLIKVDKFYTANSTLLLSNINWIYNIIYNLSYF